MDLYQCQTEIELDAEQPESQTIRVNDRCIIYVAGDQRAVMVNGIPAFHYEAGDTAAEDLFVAQAQVNGYATARELGQALGRNWRTLYRRRKAYMEEGAAGLIPKKRGPKPGSRLSKKEKAAVRMWTRQGLSQSEMARRLSRSWATIRKVQREMGLLEAEPPSDPEQLELLPTDQDDASSSSGSATVEEEQVVAEPTAPGAPAGTLDLDPRSRDVDRALAAAGELDDAVPWFVSTASVPRAGVLLAVPLLVASGLLDEAKRLYGDIGPAFYGLRTTLVTFVLMALLRIRHPENIKEYAPPELGLLLGLDRAPEVKTLRRKLRRLALGPSEELLERLLHRRAATRDEALGFLYVDGHVRVYGGKARLPKTHVARMRISLPATQDVWVNDAEGGPLFFLTQEAHPSLVAALRPVLRQVRGVVGEGRRVTVVFDRGGWSPKLFQEMDALGFDVLTYRKGKAPPVPAEVFAEHSAPGQPGTTWELAELGVRVGKRFWMRQVTRRKGDHQTHIVTTRHDLAIAEVAHRMFDRWRQENFFKYMRAEYALDGLVEYGEEPCDPTRDVPNPAWVEANKRLKQARVEVRRLEARYGAAAIDNPEQRRPTMRGFKIANGTDIGIPLRRARARVETLLAERDALPRRVLARKLERPQVRLPAARKRVSDGLKMLAYQIETDLVRVIAPSYRRAKDEGRTLIAAALQSSADLTVTSTELQVRLAPQSSPHRTRVLAGLCDQLNRTRTRFPGSALTLQFSVADHGVPCQQRS